MTFDEIANELKNGTSADDLVNRFKSQVERTEKKMKSEEKRQNNVKEATCRVAEDLTYIISSNYPHLFEILIDELSAKDAPEKVTKVLDALEEFATEIIKITNLMNPDKASTGDKEDDDDKILPDFTDILKKEFPFLL